VDVKRVLEQALLEVQPAASARGAQIHGLMKVFPRFQRSGYIHEIRMWFDPGQLIVCCEETEDDEFLFRRAAKKAGISCDIKVFTSAGAAFNYFKAQSSQKAELPSIIFIRYQLTDSSGTTLTKFIRGLPGFEKIPIVFLTAATGDSELFAGPPPPGTTIIYEKLISPETFTEIEELLRHAAEGDS
jgi:CheY-like chemotaxis protein